MAGNFQIAIDGPVAAGKSTVAKELSKAAGFVYVDTGAMYRAVALVALQRGINVEDEEALVALVREIDINVRMPTSGEKDGRLSTVLVDGKDVSWEIRKTQVSDVVARVASLPQVRKVLVPKQRLIAGRRDVVMEGRDITYVVLPEADLKIYLTASEDVRIERYFQKMVFLNKKFQRSIAVEMLKKRDNLDATREASPLRIVPGAWVLDTSELTVRQVVEAIIRRIDEVRNEEK